MSTTNVVVAAAAIAAAASQMLDARCSECSSSCYAYSYEITVSGITPANRTYSDEILQGNVRSHGTLTCKSLASSAKRAQNGAKTAFRKRFCQQNNVSFHPLPSSRFP